jgi:hypothetical protein
LIAANKGVSRKAALARRFAPRIIYAGMTMAQLRPSMENSACRAGGG